MQETCEESKGRASSSQGQQWRRERKKRAQPNGEEGGLLYPQPPNMTVGRKKVVADLGRIIRAGLTSRTSSPKQLKNHFSGRIIRPCQTGLSGPVRNNKTETAITFASGLRF